MTGVRLQGYAQTDRKRLAMPGTEYEISGYVNPDNTLTEDIKELLPGAAVGVERSDSSMISDGDA